MPHPLPGDLPARMPARELEKADEIWKSMMATLASEENLIDYDIMLCDNREDSYRDPGEGSLFIQRVPHQVRPPADTGVHYRLNEVNQEFELSLNNPPQLPDYEWNSVRVRTAHNVCQACLDVFNYYCRYIEARLVVRGLLEAPIFRKTDFESTKTGQKTIARNLCYRIPLCTILISTLCLLGQL